MPLFLVTDPQEEVTSYRVEGLETLGDLTVPAEPDGSLKLDVTALASNTPYEARICAMNGFGISPPLVFDFEMKTPATPVGARIVQG
jgi:hypothetical protein